MGSKNVLFLPGDEPGPEIMNIVESVLGLMVPELTFSHADYGRAAWEYTNEVLPPDTEDAIAEADVVFCSPSDVSNIGKKDPLDTIILYNNLYLRATEFTKLSYICSREVNACVVAPVAEVIRQINELESLDGVDSTYSTVAEDTERFFRMGFRLARMREKNRITHVVPSEIMPHSSRFSEYLFKETAKSYGLPSSVMTCSEAAELLASKPAEAGLMIGGNIVSTALRGEAFGISNSRGLTGDLYMGNNLSVYSIGRDIPEHRRNNPTAALLSAANMLMDTGYVFEGKTLVAGIKELYHDKMTTTDVTNGKMTTAEFGNCLIEWLNSN